MCQHHPISLYAWYMYMKIIILWWSRKWQYCLDRTIAGDSFTTSILRPTLDDSSRWSLQPSWGTLNPSLVVHVINGNRNAGFTSVSIDKHNSCSWIIHEILLVSVSCIRIYFCIIVLWEWKVCYEKLTSRFLPPTPANGRASVGMSTQPHLEFIEVGLKRSWP